MNIPKYYKFKDYIFTDKSLLPYYEKYKGKIFMIDHFMQEDEWQQHVWLHELAANPINVDGYVHLSDLEEVHKKEAYSIIKNNATKDSQNDN